MSEVDDLLKAKKIYEDARLAYEQVSSGAFDSLMSKLRTNYESATDQQKDQILKYLDSLTSSQSLESVLSEEPTKESAKITKPSTKKPRFDSKTARSIRKGQNFTQSDLATALGLGSSGVSKISSWETGKVSPLNINKPDNKRYLTWLKEKGNYKVSNLDY